MRSNARVKQNRRPRNVQTARQLNNVLEESSLSGRQNHSNKSIGGQESFGSGRGLLGRLSGKRVNISSRLESSRDEVLMEQVEVEKDYDSPDAVSSGGAEQFQIDDTARQSESHDPRIEAHAD